MKRQMTRLAILAATLMIGTMAWAGTLPPKSSADARSRGNSANLVERLDRLGNFSILLTALRTANLDEAVATYEAWLAVDRENPVAKHMLAACTGKNVPERASDGFVTSVPILAGPDFRPGSPVRLFALPEPPDLQTPIFEDMTADGKRLLLNVPTTSRASIVFHAILGWTALLQDDGE